MFALNSQSCREIWKLELFTACCKLLVNPDGPICTNWCSQIILACSSCYRTAVSVYSHAKALVVLSSSYSTSEQRVCHILKGYFERSQTAQDWNRDSVLKLVCAVTCTAVSKAYLNSAFAMDIPFSPASFICLGFIFRLCDTALGFFFLPSITLSLWVFLYFG